jgi:carbon-monoxide dehydrogenase medium subunit
MRPAPFSLEMPSTLREAVESVAEDGGDDVLVLAGGQSLIPMLNMRIARPDRLVDLGGVAELRSIAASGGDLVIGAMTRQEELETSDVVAQACGLIAHAVAFVGQPQTRSRGTLGGSLALGSTFSELCTCLLALNGRVGVQSLRGTRWIEAGALFEDYLTTSIAEDEILAEARIPGQAPDARWGFSELKFRGCDFPIVIAAVVLEFRGPTCVAARIAVGGAATTPMRMREAEAAVAGSTVDETAIREAASLAEQTAEPMSDLHAPADYRRRAVAVQVRRALRMATREGHS